MSAAFWIRLTLLFNGLGKKSWFWAAIAVILLLPLAVIMSFVLFLGIIVSSIFSIFSSDNEIYIKAIENVQREYAVENSFSQGSLRCIDIFMDGEEATQQELESFLSGYFIEKVEKIEEVIKDDGQTEIIKKIVIEFLQNEKLKVVLADAPFNLSPEDIEMVFTVPLFSGNGQYLKPIENGRVTSPYGWRSDPFTGQRSHHNGMDIVSPQDNADVYAITNGVVYSVSSSSVGGNMLTIRHDTEDGTIYAFYAHLATISVEPGQEVFQGQTVGQEGGDPKTDPNPGSSTGQHLHFEIRLEPNSGAHTDPTAYIGEF